MGKPIYYFGDFRLDPLARELSRNGESLAISANALHCLVYLVEHRERAVGKDELVSAVWGRVDVSDNLLAQTMVRLRRVLGDVSTEQRCIKTIPRVGYRWLLETTVVSNTPGDTVEQTPAQEIPPGADARGSVPRALSPWWRRMAVIALLVVLVVATVYGRWPAGRHAFLRFNQKTAIVLPAEVDAPEDWKWLRLGLMDLIANDLRAAKVPVESSQTVLDLLNQAGTPGDSRFDSFALIIRPHVTLVDNVWHIRLDATHPHGGKWQAESSSDNVLSAAHSASYLLLPQIGVAAANAKPASGDTREEYLMRINAASYAGAIDAERELIDKAPPDIREMPEFDYAKAAFDCNQGNYEPCKQGLADLLQRLPADKQPVLRGRVLAQQYYVYFREHKYAEGEAALSEAVQLLQKQKNTVYLAFAYAQRAELEDVDGKFDQAQSDFGLARVNYALAGHTAGALGVDASLARLAMRRGQYAQAVPVLQRAYDEYQRMGMRQFLIDPLQDLIVSQRMLLQHSDELATTGRYWPFEQTHLQISEDVQRHVLVYERAGALADNGRTLEASSLLEHVLADIQRDPTGEPGLQGCVDTLLAKLALQRGDVPASQAWIAKALAGQMLEKDPDKRDYADAWLTKVMIAQRAGNPEELKRAVATLQVWVTRLPVEDEWIAILLLRAQAAEAWSEGRHDEALGQLKLAMDKADAWGVPELIVDVGQAYTQALLAAGQVEDAASVSGKLSTWSQLDWRAAWTQACVYRALGEMSYWQRYRDKARELAGDRALPTNASVSM